MDRRHQSSKPHVLVTGGAGFIGRRLAGALLASGGRVTVLTRNVGRPAARDLQRRGATNVGGTRRLLAAAAALDSPRSAASTRATGTASRTSTSASASVSGAAASSTSPRARSITSRARRPGGRRSTNGTRNACAHWGKYWWLVDDDAVEPLPASERAAWEVVAAMQEAAQRRDVPAVHALLAEAARWPEDLALLIWAVRVCEASGAPHLPGGFERVLARLERPAPAVGHASAGLPA